MGNELKPPTLTRRASDTLLQASRGLSPAARGLLPSKKPLSRRWGCLALLYLIILFALFRHHIWCAWHLVRVYAYWGVASRGIGLSLWRDGLDVTFEAYDPHQYSAFSSGNNSSDLLYPPSPPPSATYTDADRDITISSTGMHGQDLVPPILHHILLGRPISSSPANWNASRKACLAYHPASEGWEYHFWDDEKAQSFLTVRTTLLRSVYFQLKWLLPLTQEHYPWFLPTFNGYRYPIQRADSLRYFVLYHYGGTFLDLDLECKRSLGPLRRFPTVAISAQPAGISNGFFMATPRHPFLAQLIENLESYDRDWWFSYVTIMCSTGPMVRPALSPAESKEADHRDPAKTVPLR